MVWPCTTESLCCAFPLIVMVVVLHLLLLMLWIAMLVGRRHDEVHDAFW